MILDNIDSPHSKYANPSSRTYHYASTQIQGLTLPSRQTTLPLTFGWWALFEQPPLASISKVYVHCRRLYPPNWAIWQQSRCYKLPCSLVPLSLCSKIGSRILGSIFTMPCSLCYFCSKSLWSCWMSLYHLGFHFRIPFQDSQWLLLYIGVIPSIRRPILTGSINEHLDSRRTTH